LLWVLSSFHLFLSAKWSGKYPEVIRERFLNVNIYTSECTSLAKTTGIFCIRLTPRTKGGEEEGGCGSLLSDSAGFSECGLHKASRTAQYC